MGFLAYSRVLPREVVVLSVVLSLRPSAAWLTGNSCISFGGIGDPGTWYTASPVSLEVTSQSLTTPDASTRSPVEPGTWFIGPFSCSALFLNSPLGNVMHFSGS